MMMKVLIVDSSIFFFRYLTKVINYHESLQVVGVAASEWDCLRLNKILKPDVILINLALLEDAKGKNLVKTIRLTHATPIVIFSNAHSSYDISLNDERACGVTEFIPQISSKTLMKDKYFHTKIHQKILSALDPEYCSLPLSRKSIESRIDVVVIGASTGGPLAIEEVLKYLPNNFPVPIVIIQHMPQVFTMAFIDLLSKQTALNVECVQDCMRLRPGHVFVAPGGSQLTFNDSDPFRVNVTEDARSCGYKPSVDTTFDSAAGVFKDRVLGIVLTGMGNDGVLGAEKLSSAGSTIWTQDEQTSVVYGMPKAIENAGLSHFSLPLHDVHHQLMKVV